MAVRKETIKQQFNEALPAALQPGEQVLGGACGVSGPNPFWAIVGARLGPGAAGDPIPAAG